MKNIVDNLKFLPAFADFILNKYLEEYVKTQKKISLDLQLPLMKFYSHMTEAEMNEVGMNSSREYLRYMSENRVSEQMEKSITDWKNNQLVHLEKDQIELDDLLLISFMRKRTFIEMLHFYTTEISLVNNIIEEIDKCFLANDQATINTYIDLLKGKIKEDIYFKEKLTDTSPGFYYIFDVNTRHQIQGSFKLFKYLGYAEVDYKSNPDFFTSLVHQNDLDAAEPYFKKLMESKDGEVHFFEYRLLAKDKHYKWMRNYESVYKRNIHGKPNLLLGVAFDISKEKDITEKLINRENELLEAQALANIGSYSWNIPEDRTVRTKQTEIILGLQENDTMNEAYKKIHRGDIDFVLEAVQNSLKGDGEFDTEYRITIDNTEKIIWGRGRVEFENNKPITMKGTVMDVTDKHHMLQKLQRSERLYKQAEILNKLGNWTWEIKNDNLEWSDELYRIFDMEPQVEKVNFERYLSFIHPDDVEERKNKLTEQMGTREVMDYHFRIITATGRHKIIYGQSRVLYNDNNEPVKIMGTCQDVTKQKTLEENLNRKTQELERSNASLQDFAFLSSHDLKEPLRKIAVFGDRLRTMQADNLHPDSMQTINKMVDAATRLQQMVDELLSLSQINSDMHFEKVSLNDIFHQVIQQMDDQIAGVNISCDTLPVISVNPVQIRQLFENLISNALKFTRKDITPSITIACAMLGKNEKETCKLDSKKKYVKIEVSDNGIGFDQQLAEKIFTIFQRLHKAEYEGTGIGLALCKKIVEHHNGVIYATGQPMNGATFTVILPVEN